MLVMLKRYRILFMLSFFLFVGSKSSLAQCLQLIDGTGSFVTNLYWVSCTGGNFSLFLQPDIAVGNYTIDWGDGNTSTDEFPQHFYTQLGVYDIMLIASTSNNCIDTFMLSAVVEALSEGGIKIPNAFSPSIGGSNGGLFLFGNTDNDVFHPIIIGAEEYELNIFNKWGELLFVSKDVNIGWDGYYRNDLSKMFMCIR